MNYPQLAFSEASKKMQKRYGSRDTYERMEQFSNVDGMSLREVNFIQERDSFYMASSGPNEFPYIQHRGGPKGFLKVLDNKTLAFLDFAGNKQYITVGNIQSSNKVSLFLMDYPNQTRLKIYAESEIVELDEQPELVQKLDLDNYRYKPERILMFSVRGFDWNCPQHITQRYSEAEIKEAFAEQLNYTEQLEKQVQELKLKLEQIKN